MSFMFKNHARPISNKAGHYVALSKTVDTPVNGLSSLFRIDSVHQMETSLSHALSVY
jgi:hypothetical protein